MTASRRSGAERRTEPWLRLDAGVPFDPMIIDIVSELGSDGGWGYIVLLCNAKLQEKVNPAGDVIMGWTQYAQALGGDSSQARSVVDGLVARGLVDLVEDQPLQFLVRINGWEDKQRPADPTAARRKAEQREREKAERDPSPIPTNGDADGASDRDIAVTPAGQPDCHAPTGTRTETETSSSPAVVVAGVAGAGEGNGLHPQLTEVLAILEAAPNVAVEPASVDSALRAYPTADAVRAAHEVASFAHEGGLNVMAANRLLMAQLRKQLEQPRDHGRRRFPPRAAPTGAARRSAEEQALFDRTQRELAQARATPTDEEITF